MTSYLFGRDFTRFDTVTVVRDFPTKEDGEEHADTDKDGQQPKNPTPPQILGQLPRDKGRDVGKRLVHDDEDGGTCSSFVHKVQVADEGVDDALKVRHAQALDHASTQHRTVRRGRGGPDGPGESADHGKQKARTFAVFPGPGGHKGAYGARDQEAVSGQVGELGEIDLEVRDEWHSYWGKGGTESEGREVSEEAFIHHSPFLIVSRVFCLC